MIIGLHHLTTVKEGAVGEGRAFGSVAEAILAMDQGSLDLGAPIKLRVTGYTDADGITSEKPRLVETTLGRALFNEALPEDYPYFENLADKGDARKHCERPCRALPEG